jgi:hypothetical protein
MPRPSLLVEKNASYSRASTSGDNPRPLSVTLNSMVPAGRAMSRGTTRSSMCRLAAALAPRRSTRRRS